MKHFLIYCILFALLLSGCTTPPPEPPTSDVTQGSEQGSEDPSGNTSEGNTISTGWLTEAAQTFYINEDGSRHTGWLELDGKRYYLDDSGVLQTGWLELEGQQYYLQDDGAVTCGKAMIDGYTHYFTASGIKVIVANPWNIIPADYTPDLVSAEDGYLVDRSCRDALLQMLADCRKAGFDGRITSAYRKHETQINLFNNKVWYFIDLGYDEVTARQKAATIIATPGTSEHELGLAVDLVDSSYWVLDEAQENTPAQKWLMEHCWEYGFILRYPNDKSEATGIIYEPWHYRYVGKALAAELHTSGLCLEEYFDQLY